MIYIIFNKIKINKINIGDSKIYYVIKYLLNDFLNMMYW